MLATKSDLIFTASFKVLFRMPSKAGALLSSILLQVFEVIFSGFSLPPGRHHSVGLFRIVAQLFEAVLLLLGMASFKRPRRYLCVSSWPSLPDFFLNLWQWLLARKYALANLWIHCSTSSRFAYGKAAAFWASDVFVTYRMILWLFLRLYPSAICRVWVPRKMCFSSKVFAVRSGHHPTFCERFFSSPIRPVNIVLTDLPSGWSGTHVCQIHYRSQVSFSGSIWGPDIRQYHI